ncbi:sensor histidine kinase, partial [Arsenicibacter rosenii]|uniref:sensor histidine kinase n=1 Tax=Arsenicibacter rosenii TaxID=1750698 RepID=UPI000A5C571C
VPRIGLTKELAYIQNYIDLEQNRLLGEDIQIDYQQLGDPSSYQIAPLLLIAFVENAFKHGIKGANGPAFVKVTASIQSNLLTFSVENSIPPVRRRAEPQNDDKRRGGVGLTNVKRRLDAIYPDLYALSITPDEGIYKVELTITLFKRSDE